MPWVITTKDGTEFTNPKFNYLERGDKFFGLGIDETTPAVTEERKNFFGQMRKVIVTEAGRKKSLYVFIPVTDITCVIWQDSTD